MRQDRTIARARILFTRQMLLAWLLFVSSLVATVTVTVSIWQGIDRNEQRALGVEADEVTAKIQDRLLGYELILRGAVGLFESSTDVSRREWKIFANGMELERTVPGVLGLGYTQLIRPEDLAAHEAAVRDEGYPDYTVHPTGTRDVYTSIVLLEPFKGRNLRAFGFDAFTESTRRAVMEQARDTGEPALSRMVRLVQETDVDIQPGVLIYLPVYRPGAIIDTTERRREAIIGWVYSPFRMNDLMNATLGQWNQSDGSVLDLHIYQDLSYTDASLLYDTHPENRIDPDGASAEHRVIDFYGRRWLLVFDRMEGASAGHTVASAALALGLLISWLLFALVVSWRSTRSRAELMAAELTEDLRERDAELVASEYRWKFAVEGTGDGLWDWNIVNGSVFMSRQWKAMLGYEDDELVGRVEEWSERVHPADRATTMHVLDEYLAGRRDRYENEHRVRCKDGSYKWILDRGMVVERDADGRPVRMIGTHTDITERRAATDRITHLTNLYRALSECSAATARAADETELFDDICRVVVERGGMTMAVVSRPDPTTDLLVPVVAHGTGLEYLDGLEISVRPDDARGQGPVGTAFREGHSVWFENFRANARAAPWRERAARFGWDAVAALPLLRDGSPVAVLSLYCNDRTWFDGDTMALLEEMVGEINFALDKLGAEATQREAEQRFRSLVEQGIAGAYIIQDGRFVYVNQRFKEILGYDPDDDLAGMAAADMFPADEMGGAMDGMQAVLGGDQGRADGTFQALRKDGTRVALGSYISVATYHGEQAIIGLLQDVSDRAVAEAHIRQYAERLERLILETVGLITTLGERRDPYTAGHEGRVADLAVAIGREMGLDDDFLEGLRISGLLHDIGKISVPTEILVKPTSLTPLESAMIREHPVVGYDILKSLDFPWPVARVALEHHERMDGSGYPEGLRGDEISLEARIVAVADVVESMSSHRPYRAALGIEAALQEVESGAGTRFDAQVVDACIKVCRTSDVSVVGSS